MHDPTEGGISGGIHEIADASGVGVYVYEEKIPISPETAMICRSFQIDPLQLISSGALLISAEPGSAEKITDKLIANDIEAAVIGEFLESPTERKLVQTGGLTTDLVRPVCDHLWVALEN